MIKVNFFTNLDLINPDKPHIGLPREMPFRPCVGDLFQSAYKHKGGFHLELEVVRITIVPKTTQRQYADIEEVIGFELRTELHLPKGRWETLRTFYDFYERITGHKFL